MVLGPSLNCSRRTSDSKLRKIPSLRNWRVASMHKLQEASQRERDLLSKFIHYWPSYLQLNQIEKASRNH